MSVNTSATSGLSYRAFAFGIAAAAALVFGLQQPAGAPLQVHQATPAEPIIKLETVVVTGKRHASPMVAAHTSEQTLEQLPTVVVVGHRSAFALS
ncbi:MAG: hypothetical protein JOY60_05705 [Burkholderiaceae bacterium]|nr:hypothetical protein [Burkholderiaceae bacterium]